MAHHPRRQINQPRWLPRFSKAISNLKTANDWYRALTLIYKLSIRNRLNLVTADNVVSASTSTSDIAHVGGPYARFYVDLNSPDGVIIAAFRHWLAIARDVVPAPTTKRGRSAFNGHFGPVEFDSWRSLRIAEYGALVIWRARSPLNRQQITDKQIGDWIERRGSNILALTQAKLKQALTELPALAAQVAQEMANSPQSDAAIKEQIRRDLQGAPCPRNSKN
jgi:hypothetical protein